MSNEIYLVVKKEVSKIYALLEVMPFTKIGSNSRAVVEIEFPRSVYMEIPLRLDFDESIVLADNSLNALLLLNIEALTAAIMEKAEEQDLPRPDFVQCELKLLTTDKSLVSSAEAQWALV